MIFKQFHACEISRKRARDIYNNIQARKYIVFLCRRSGLAVAVPMNVCINCNSYSTSLDSIYLPNVAISDEIRE